MTRSGGVDEQGSGDGEKEWRQGSDTGGRRMMMHRRMMQWIGKGAGMGKKSGGRAVTQEVARLHAVVGWIRRKRGSGKRVGGGQ